MKPIQEITRLNKLLRKASRRQAIKIQSELDRIHRILVSNPGLATV